MSCQQRGFTLIEMLVSVTLFSMVVLAVYYFLDRGRWLYLHSERRANMQENGRLAMEAMEREMRLISFGVPEGTAYGSESTWLPAIFEAGINFIGFRGDIENRNSLVTENITNPTVAVANVDWICPATGDPLLIIERGRNWFGSTCNNIVGLTVIMVPPPTRNFNAAEIELFAPMHVFYRFTPDTNNDGICDDTSDLTQCQIQRATRLTNTPETDPENDTDWQVFATNITQFKLRYFIKGSSTPLVPLTALSGLNLSIIDVIRVDITATDRADRAGQYQESNYRTEILVRKRKF
ncbi:prepilin-type N-terminal cleavage/methylation domain-containing protein [bacterium]|nr:prepilin-type N-terminal cleavage/methylation domain-containing protein [bacterium]MCI0605027.1 prepilin-type N-terminal cleavage/methylation domain-containing protein [bacterium]